MTDETNWATFDESAAKIKVLMTDRGISPKELGDRAHLEPEEVERLLNGEWDDFGVEVIPWVAAALRTTPEYLLSRCGSKPDSAGGGE